MKIEPVNFGDVMFKTEWRELEAGLWIDPHGRILVQDSNQDDSAMLITREE